VGVKLGSLTLREDIDLKVYEKRVLRRIFGTKREESCKRLEKTA